LHCERNDFSTGVFVPIEDTLLYTPLGFCGRTIDSKAGESSARKTKETLDAAKRRSESEKAKRRAEEEKKQKERALFWDEFQKAFRFQVVEHRMHNDRPTTVVTFNPDSTYRQSLGEHKLFHGSGQANRRPVG
jgi:hypothetical protein